MALPGSTMDKLVLTWLRDAAGAARERGNDCANEAGRAKSETYRNACRAMADAHYAAAKVYQEAHNEYASGS